jgi:hypothetical protein
MIIIDFGALPELEKGTEMAVSLLKKYAGANNLEMKKLD